MKNNKELILGIDLGTTYSCVGIWKNGKVEIVPNEIGERTTPSIVSFDKNERLIGKAAKYKNKNIIYDAKRLIGRNYDDKEIQEDMKYWPFKVIKDDNNRPLFEINNDDGKIEKFYPEEISSMILSKLKEDAKNFCGHEIKKAIITVPAYFNESQREATRDAGKIAGLEVLKIINEPTAAALAYGLSSQHKGTKNLFVFDLGGGTFDVSIVRLENSKYNVLATNGDTHLGGEDFDNLLMKYCMDEFKIQTNIDISNNQKAMRRLKVHCEKIKRDLSCSNQVELDIDALAEGEDLNMTITKANFEYICQESFEKCIPPMKEALNDAKLNKEDIDEIILVGGSTRIPKNQEIVTAFFNGKELCKSIHADEAVAYGAAVQASLYLQNNKDNKIQIYDINPLSLGVNLIGDRMNFYITKGMQIPAKVSKKQKTVKDNQSKISFKIYQGERLFCKDNTYLGEININGLRPAPRGEVKFQITMELDENTILKVHAKEVNGDLEKDLNIQNFNDRLTKEEIEKYLKEEQYYKEQDLAKKKDVDEKLKLQNIIYTLEKKSKTLQGEIKKKIDSKIDETKTWLRDNQKENINVYKSKIEELKSFLKNLK